MLNLQCGTIFAFWQWELLQKHDVSQRVYDVIGSDIVRTEASIAMVAPPGKTAATTEPAWRRFKTLYY